MVPALLNPYFLVSLFSYAAAIPALPAIAAILLTRNATAAQVAQRAFAPAAPPAFASMSCFSGWTSLWQCIVSPTSLPQSEYNASASMSDSATSSSWLWLITALVHTLGGLGAVSAVSVASFAFYSAKISWVLEVLHFFMWPILVASFLYLFADTLYFCGKIATGHIIRKGAWGKYLARRRYKKNLFLTSFGAWSSGAILLAEFLVHYVRMFTRCLYSCATDFFQRLSQQGAEFKKSATGYVEEVYATNVGAKERNVMTKKSKDVIDQYKKREKKEEIDDKALASKAANVVWRMYKAVNYLARVVHGDSDKEWVALELPHNDKLVHKQTMKNAHLLMDENELRNYETRDTFTVQLVNGYGVPSHDIEVPTSVFAFLNPVIPKIPRDVRDKEDPATSDDEEEEEEEEEEDDADADDDAVRDGTGNKQSVKVVVKGAHPDDSARSQNKRLDKIEKMLERLAEQGQRKRTSKTPVTSDHDQDDEDIETESKPDSTTKPDSKPAAPRPASPSACTPVASLLAALEAVEKSNTLSDEEKAEETAALHRLIDAQVETLKSASKRTTTSGPKKDATTSQSSADGSTTSSRANSKNPAPRASSSNSKGNGAAPAAASSAAAVASTPDGDNKKSSGRGKQQGNNIASGKKNGNSTEDSSVFMLNNKRIVHPTDTCYAITAAIALYACATVLLSLISKDSTLGSFTSVNHVAQHGVDDTLKIVGWEHKVGKAADALKMFNRLARKLCVRGSARLCSFISWGESIPVGARAIAAMLYTKAGTGHWRPALPATRAQQGNSTTRRWYECEGGSVVDKLDADHVTYIYRRHNHETVYLTAPPPQPPQAPPSAPAPAAPAPTSTTPPAAPARAGVDAAPATPATTDAAPASPAASAMPDVMLGMGPAKCIVCDKSKASHPTKTVGRCSKCDKPAYGKCFPTTTTASAGQGFAGLLGPDSGSDDDDSAAPAQPPRQWLCPRCDEKEHHDGNPDTIADHIPADVKRNYDKAAASSTHSVHTATESSKLGMPRHVFNFMQGPGGNEYPYWNGRPKHVSSTLNPEADFTCRQGSASPLSAGSGADVMQLKIIEELSESKWSKIALLGLTTATRTSHMRELQSIQRFARMFPSETADLPPAKLVLAHIRYQLANCRNQWWQPQTIERHLSCSIGAFNHLSCYTDTEYGAQLMKDGEFASALKAIKLKAAESQPTRQAAATWEQVEKAMALEVLKTIRAALLLQWISAGRVGDVFGLKKEHVDFSESTGNIDITFSTGKGVIARGGLYTVHTVVPAACRTWLAAHLRSLRKGEYIVHATAAVPLEKRLLAVNRALARAGKITTRSIRRGALQAMAMGSDTEEPVDLETLMSFAGHKNPDTTRRYLDWSRKFGQGAVKERKAAGALTAAARA